MNQPQVTHDASSASGEMGVLDIVLMLAENLRVVIIVPLVTAVAALGITFLMQPTYTAVTRIIPPQQQQSVAANLLASQLGGIAGVVGAAAGIKNPADTYVSMLRSRTIADNLLSRFKLLDVYKEKQDEDARDELGKRTRINTGKDGFIVIEVEDQDPKRAADIANAYVDELHGLTQKLAVTEAAQRRLFFQTQLKQTKDDLTKAEIALRGSGISEATLKTVPQSALEAVARLKAQVTAHEVKLGAMRAYMTDKNPEFTQVQQELAVLRAQLAKAQEVDVNKATGAGTEYIEKFRDFKYHEALFDLMAKQYESARLDEAREGSVIQVIDTAVPPQRKSSPKRALMAMLAALTALFLVLVVVSINEALRRASTNPHFYGSLQKLWRALRVKPMGQ